MEIKKFFFIFVCYYQIPVNHENTHLYHIHTRIVIYIQGKYDGNRC